MKFKTKLVHAVVLGALGVAGSAQAVHLSDDGRGEVLIYPYYTAQNGNDTIFTLVNTTANGKAVKVRIIEGMNSYEVLDFNLYLSPNDAWSAAITSDGAGGAKIVTADKSCTAPAIPAAGQAFRTFAIQDAGPKTAARTKEGYIEVIEMGTIDSAAVLAPSTVTFGKAVTHVAGVPGNCDAIRGAWGAGGAFTGGASELTANSGGLIGSAAIVNVTAGTDYSFDPVVISAFNNSVGGNHTSPGSTLPSLNNATPTISNVFYNAGVLTSNWSAIAAPVLPGADSVSAVLMHQYVLNEYTVNPAINAATDVVITFPTKRQYINNVTVAGAYTGDRPFTQDFLAVGGVATGACEPVSIIDIGREEETPITTIDFSPQPPSGSNALCWEANVISMGGAKVLGSENLNYNLPAGYLDGWLSIGFLNVGHVMLDDVPVVDLNYRGLPAVGFAVQRYVNSNVGGVLSNYGGAYINKYVRTVN